MEEGRSGKNGINVPSPVESSLAVCGGIEIKPFLDKSCNPETNHMAIKIEPCEDVDTAQNKQESMMEYHELEGCLDIKSEELDIKNDEDECDRYQYDIEVLNCNN
ncbi:hypothetical protein NQ318_015480 [Aromia moschata]|uniref:Uncharacterized protein n=1 Tax=Aromia moschata TaxID=1265417 RepID=A0AAV8XHQ1_9CUCU|nr:hypothetical protein NQ318_015480 [Aromia moschata]